MALKTFKEFQAIVMESMELASITESTTELNEAVDLAAKQQLINDIVKGNLTTDEQNLFDALVDKIVKTRTLKFKIADKSTEKKELNWKEATAYVKTLGAGWRLPTEEELLQISRTHNDFNPMEAYWTSDNDKKGTTARTVSYVGTNGKAFGGHLGRAFRALVRAVKD